YKDIQKVKRHTLAWSRRNPWNDYGYFEIILHNGERVKFTSLLVCSTQMETFLENNYIVIEKVEELFTWVS
ncbi:MAG TPA: hypothetical protein VL092_05660, partial [Chitinophagaceae bacterium]|nr:hypothetical protein [Chitinophagaceae bacterium]